MGAEEEGGRKEYVSKCSPKRQPRTDAKNTNPKQEKNRVDAENLTTVCTDALDDDVMQKSMGFRREKQGVHPMGYNRFCLHFTRFFFSFSRIDGDQRRDNSIRILPSFLPSPVSVCRGS
jgi:hypothetical protein